VPFGSGHLKASQPRRTLDKLRRQGRGKREATPLVRRATERPCRTITQHTSTRIYSSSYVGRQLDTTKVVYVTEDRIDPLAPVPPYRQIADILRRRIESGQYPAGARIPTESEIVEEFEVARTTARRAVGVLRGEGLIYTVAQRGSYVVRPPASSA
jgi:GntR family transcriptional regulator